MPIVSSQKAGDRRASRKGVPVVVSSSSLRLFCAWGSRIRNATSKLIPKITAARIIQTFLHPSWPNNESTDGMAATKRRLVATAKTPIAVLSFFLNNFPTIATELRERLLCPNPLVKINTGRSNPGPGRWASQKTAPEKAASTAVVVQRRLRSRAGPVPKRKRAPRNVAQRFSSA